MIVSVQDFVLRRRTPTLAAIWIGTYLVLALVFAWVYSWISGSYTVTSSPNRDFGYAAYLSFITQATLGYSDVYPLGTGRVIANVQALIGTVMNGVALGLITVKLLRRPKPLYLPKRVVFMPATDGFAGSLWLRYLNIDSEPLVDSKVSLYFWAAGRTPKQLERYGSIGLNLYTTNMRSIPSWWVMSLKLAHVPTAPAFNRLVDSDLNSERQRPFSVGYFMKGGKPDKSARLLLRVVGTNAATGESFAAISEYRISDIVCGSFNVIQNDETNLENRKSLIRKDYEQTVAHAARKCPACETFGGCPFAKPIGNGQSLDEGAQVGEGDPPPNAGDGDRKIETTSI